MTARKVWSPTDVVVLRADLIAARTAGVRANTVKIIDTVNGSARGTTRDASFTAFVTDQSGQVFTPVFTSGAKAMATTVVSGVASVGLTATESGATIKYGYSGMVIGASGSTIATGVKNTIGLFSGSNTITISATKPGYADSKYTVTVARPA